MRVPVYQQQVTPQIPSVRTQVQVPAGATGVALKPVDTSAGLTQGVESLRLGLMKMNENREKFMLASAVNEYRRSNTEFLHAKDTGLFAKKGKDVFGISQAYDEFSSKTMEDIAKRYKMSGVARDRFVEATSALYNASLSSVMQHEQRETDAAQQAEWKTMINDSLNAVALSPYDDAVCEENWKIMAGAIAQQNAPYGDKVVESKLAEGRSQHLMARLAPMLEDSPKAADAFLKAHNGELTGDDRLKARKAVDNKLDVIKVQETTDALVKKFRGNEQAALQYIHKNYEGDMENKMISSVKSRFSEMKIRAYNAASAQTAQINKNYKIVEQDIRKNGTQYDPAELRKIFPEDKAAALIALMDEQLSYRKAKVRAERNPAYAGATRDEQDEMILRERGISKRQHLSDWQTCWNRVVNREADEDDVKGWVGSGVLFRREGAELVEMMKNLSDENAAVLKSATKEVRDTFAELSNTYSRERYPNFDPEGAVAAFEREAGRLSKKGERYPEAIEMLKAKAFTTALDSHSGLPMESWGSPSAAGRIAAYYRNIDVSRVRNNDFVPGPISERNISEINRMLVSGRRPSEKSSSPLVPGSEPPAWSVLESPSRADYGYKPADSVVRAGNGATVNAAEPKDTTADDMGPAADPDAALRETLYKKR